MTGATRKGRLGYQIARCLLEEGNHLVIAEHAHPCDLPSCYPSQVRTCPVDFADPQSIPLLIEAAGAFDGIINAASEFLPARFGETSLDEFRRVMDIHAVAPFVLAQCYARTGMQGSIVHLLDSNALSGPGKRTAYRLAKQALADQVRLLAPVLAPRIRINGVAPGLVVVAQGEEEFSRKECATLPLERLATTGEVFQAVRYLLEAPSVTGQTLFVDSGAFLR